MTTGMKRDRDGIKRNATPSYFVNLATSPAAAAAATTKLRVSAHHKKEEKKKCLGSTSVTGVQLST